MASNIHKLFALTNVFYLLYDVQSALLEPCPIVNNLESCNSEHVKFYLYSRFFKDTPEYVEIKDDSDNITSSSYQSGKTTKMIFHGYSVNMTYEILQNMKDEYLRRYEDANVWMVDYGSIVPEPCYITSVRNTKYIGKCVAQFIERLINVTYGTLDIHLIGHSLGAQVTANVAPFLKSYRIPRITGLDPALPLFGEIVRLARRLRKDSAMFVDVVHTNSFLAGQAFATGQIDFYMNNATIQPGCDPSSSGLEGEVDKISCSHSRAVEYFAESINSMLGFWGLRCEGNFDSKAGKCETVPPYVKFGEDVDKTLKGKYVVLTKSESPYAQGKSTEVK